MRHWRKNQTMEKQRTCVEKFWDGELESLPAFAIALKWCWSRRSSGFHCAGIKGSHWALSGRHIGTLGRPSCLYVSAYDVVMPAPQRSVALTFNNLLGSGLRWFFADSVAHCVRRFGIGSRGFVVKTLFNSWHLHTQKHRLYWSKWTGKTSLARFMAKYGTFFSDECTEFPSTLPSRHKGEFDQIDRSVFISARRNQDIAATPLFQSNPRLVLSQILTMLLDNCAEKQNRK